MKKEDDLEFLAETVKNLVSKNRKLFQLFEAKSKYLKDGLADLKEMAEYARNTLRRNYRSMDMKVIKNKSVLELLIGKDKWMKDTIRRSASLKAKIERMTRMREKSRKEMGR